MGNRRDYRKLWRDQGPVGFARFILIKRIGKPIFRGLDGFIGQQSLVGDPEVFDPASFEWVPELEANWKKVREELDGLLEIRDQIPALHDLQPDQTKISWNDDWKTWMLYGFNYRSEVACARCPETARMLEQIPGMTTAWFSILAPGKHIPRHAGITKGNIRCHLALKVPKNREKVRMQVGDEMIYWDEGRCVLFDDSRKHEVWNETDEERVVLIFDFERPMRWRGRAVNRALRQVMRWSPFFRAARRNQRAWEQRLQAAGAA